MNGRQNGPHGENMKKTLKTRTAKKADDMNTEYVLMKADQLKRHKKVFTRWINLQLAKAKPPAKVTDLTRDLRDGQILLTLMEVLFGVKVTRAEPTSKRINQIKNVQEAMSILLQNNIKSFGVIASEITAGDEKAILSLLWQIIRWRQITEVIKPDPMDYDEDKKLITWCQERIKGNSNVHISNLTTDWKDGLAFNILLHSFNPSLFDLDTISSKDEMSRRAHAINLATTEYGMPAIFDPKDFDKDTADKTLITLFLSYLYQFAAKGSSVTIVKKEVISPFETSLMTEEYGFKTITTRHETSRLGNTTVDFQTITRAGEKDQDDAFHDFKVDKESGQKTLLHTSTLAQGVSVEQRRSLVVSPFRRQSGGSSRASSGASSPISKDLDPKELELEIHRLARPPDTLGEGSYTFTQTTRIVTNGSEKSSSTTTTYRDPKEDFLKLKSPSQISGEESGRYRVTRTRKIITNSGGQSLQSSAENSQTVMKTTDGGDKYILDKQGETDAKYREVTLQVTPILGKNIKESQQPLFPREDENKQKAKITVHAIEEVQKTSLSGTRDVLLISAERFSNGGGTAREAEPANHDSSYSLTDKDGRPASGVSPAQYYKYSIDNSTSARSNDLVDYLKKKLDTLDQSLSDLECSVKHSDKDSMDLKSSKNALDQHKEVLNHLTSVESDTYDVQEEGKQLIKDKRFDRAHGEYFHDRIEVTVIRITTIKEDINREHQRLFDLYLILLRQHLERMNDWLLRAESRISLDDVIEPTYKRVQQQVWDHQAFQEELSNYSMANMILDMDLEHPALDETIKDWVKVLSERWAAVWNWAEEWKEKLNQALIDWENLREEEAALLSWLSSKEQTFDLIEETDISNEEQVTMHLNLLETTEKEMESHEGRLDSLRETGEKLIKDAEYHDATAKGIRDQVDDFGTCWKDITESIKERKAMLEEAQNKVKRMGILMKEVRAWLYEAEQCIKLASLQEDPQKETKIQEKIEIECEEREKNQPKVDEVKRLEDLLSNEIDKKSNYYLKRVTKPFHKRWDDASMALNRYRNEDYPFVKPSDCFLVERLKKALIVN
ncbi:uncharacterized protein [Porites lutea]|uniref:uncharacterized protein n=1 Tax=Porites lutea TaxID=51062 RepID=UPI003CC5FE24